MNQKITFIYDGECPFCKKFAELLELKSNFPNLILKNGREVMPELVNVFQKGLNLDNGAILLKGNEIIQGADAINFICSEIDNPSDSLLELLRLIFSSKGNSYLIFPLLLWARRAILIFKGIPREVKL